MLIFNSFNPQYLQWYSPNIGLEHTIQVCRGERVKELFVMSDREYCVLIKDSTFNDFIGLHAFHT